MSTTALNPLGLRPLIGASKPEQVRENVGALKAPSAGALLELRAPVAPPLDDVLTAACVDFSVLPRGYLA